MIAVARTAAAASITTNTREGIIDRDLRVLCGSAAEPPSRGRSGSRIIDNQESLIIAERKGAGFFSGIKLAN